MRTYDFIKMIKEKHNLSSDYAVAKHLGVTDTLISFYKTGKSGASNDMVMLIANDLDIPFDEVLGHVEMERATDEKKRNMWREFLKKSARAAILALSVLPIALWQSGDVQASTGSLNNYYAQGFDLTINYTK